MIDKLIYMLKKDRRFYIIIFVIYLLEIFGGSLVYQMREFFVGTITEIMIVIPVLMKVGRLDELLLLGFTRKQYYVLIVIYDFLLSALSAVAIGVAKIRVDSIPKNYFNYIFLFYLIFTLVVCSTFSFNQIFRHSDYWAVRFGVLFLYVLIFFARYTMGFSAENFTNFNENLVSYEDFKLKEYYIMFLIIIGFNYVTSYLAHKSVEIKIIGEVE